MDLTETRVSSEPIFEGTFLSITRDTVRLPNGKEAYRLIAQHPGAVCVLAITDNQEVILVRQWRYATGQALLEVPAGKLDIEGEDIATCALRELAEETSYTAESVSLVRTFYTAPGFCNEKMYLFKANGVRFGSQLAGDDDEFTETVLLTKEQVRLALDNQEIQDGKTLIALQYWLMDS